MRPSRPCDCRCRGCQGVSKSVRLFSGQNVYGPWMRRQGDYLRATAELIQMKGGVNLVVRAYTKNEEARGDGVDIDSSRTITTATPGRKLQEWGATGVGVRELIRYQYSCNIVTTGGTIQFRMLKGCWFDTVGLSGEAVLPPAGGE